MKRYILSPDPPKAGSSLIVCYDFITPDENGDSASSPVAIDLTYEPPTGSLSITLTAGVCCETVSVPAGAKLLTLHDQTGQSEDRTAPVV